MQTSNKELILLVDDDPGNLKRAQTILGEEFRISATTSGKMALSLLSKVTPDLILLDVNMPEMNGFETLKKIRELENGSMIPVVFLTGDNDAETETKCFEAGAMDFVGKPFVSQVLVSRVKRILENRQYQNHLEEMVASQVAEMTRMQDEVHRFAISYHRKLRDQSMTKSVLDTVSGIGPKRKKELLKHFKSMKQMRLASVEQLSEVIPEDVAKILYARLHENK